jgi:hypothetical protein
VLDLGAKERESVASLFHVIYWFYSIFHLKEVLLVAEPLSFPRDMNLLIPFSNTYVIISCR